MSRCSFDHRVVETCEPDSEDSSLFPFALSSPLFSSFLSFLPSSLRVSSLSFCSSSLLLLLDRDQIPQRIEGRCEEIWTSSSDLQGIDHHSVSGSNHVFSVMLDQRLVLQGKEEDVGMLRRCCLASKECFFLQSPDGIILLAQS